MSAVAGTAIVKIIPEGTAQVQGAFGGVKKAAEDLGRQGATALRTVAQSAASVVDAGKLGAGSLATMLGQLGDLAVGFGAAGPLVGALAVASGAMIKLFVDSRDEIKKTEQAAEDELLRLRLAASSSGTIAAAEQKFVDLAKAQGALATANIKLAAAQELARKSNASIGAEKILASAEKEHAAALEKVNELQRQQTELAHLAAHQYDLEAQARKRLDEIERQRQARTPEGQAKALSDEVSALAELAKANKLTADDLARITALQDRLTAATERGTAAMRAQAQAQLDKLRQSGAILGAGGPRVNTISAAFGGPMTEDEVNAQTDKALAAQSKALNRRIHVTVQGATDAASAEAAKMQDTLSETFAESVAQSVGEGIAQGFERGFASGSIGEGFRQMTGALLSGLGHAMVQFGTASLLTAQLMDKIKKGLSSFLPGGAITASLAMIAIGAGLEAAGSAASSSFGGGFGSSVAGAGQGGVFGVGEIVRNGPGQTGGALMPSSPALGGVTINNPVFLSPRDPGLQAQIGEVVTRAMQRGLVRT